MQSKKYEWHGSDEELQKLMSDGKISIEGEWTTATSEKEKFYDAKEFIQAAQYYYTLTPPDLVQTSAKLWLACVYCVKDLYLQIKIYPVSHKSLAFLVELAASQCSAKLAVSLTKSWKYAEDFRKYSYGSSNFNPSKFESRKDAVESFVRDFAMIDKSAVLNEAKNLFNSVNKEITFERNTGRTSLGKKQYDYDYEAY